MKEEVQGDRVEARGSSRKSVPKDCHEARRGGSALFDLYRPSRSTNDWGARSDVGPAIASPSYFHVACSRFQWRRGIESLSMGHLPLPSSSTATVKRRGGLPPDYYILLAPCPAPRGGEETYPTPAPSRRLPPPPFPASFFLVTSGRIAAVAERIAGEHRLSVSRPALPSPPWDILLLFFLSSFFGHFFQRSVSSVVSVVTHGRESRPTRRRWIRGQGYYFARGPDTNRADNEDSGTEREKV